MYEGPEFIDAFGKQGVSGSLFEFNEYKIKQQWVTNWFKWNEDSDPILAKENFLKLLQSTPILSDTLNQLDFTWWGAIGKNLPADSFATDAVTTIETEKGMYDIAVTADDFVQVYVDGKLAIDGWDPKYTVYDEYTHHRAPLDLSKGTHTIRVIHAEKTGLATLMFYIKPIKDKVNEPVYQQRIIAN